MSTELSDNAKAILLLTAPLIVGKKRGVERPLTPTQYNKLAGYLHEGQREPADLLGTERDEILRACQTSFDLRWIDQLLKRGFLLSQAIERWQTRGIWVVCRADAEYPPRLKTRLSSNAPPVLYGCGDASLLGNGGLAVVGSRNANDELLEHTAKIGNLAVESGCTIISGAARGVDRAAMNGALMRGGTAVGVLAEGLEKAALNHENREMLMDGQLVLISQYDPRAGWNVGNAMQRNKVIYALSDAGLIMESNNGKGGTWSGAVEQLAKLHHVPVYVHTRNEGEMSSGLKALRRKGARDWPNPETTHEFRAVFEDTSISPKKEEIAQQLLPGLEQKKLGILYSEQDDGKEVSPANILFAKVKQLLEAMDMPIRESNVAECLQVNKTQARAWLYRLVAEGKYKKLDKPVRFHKIT